MTGSPNSEPGRNKCVREQPSREREKPVSDDVVAPTTALGHPTSNIVQVRRPTVKSWFLGAQRGLAYNFLPLNVSNECNAYSKHGQRCMGDCFLLGLKVLTTKRATYKLRVFAALRWKA